MSKSQQTGESEQVQLGITPPISTREPTPADIVASRRLHDVLANYKLFPTRDEERRNKSVLSKLDSLFDTWLYESSVSQGWSEQDARGFHGSLLTFGSYRLGVNVSGSDIDVLFVAPRHISRLLFFSSFVTKLLEDGNVSKAGAIMDAYTPIIKLTLYGVDVDALFASLALTSIPKTPDFIMDDSILKNIDDKTVRSVNGCRVAPMIMSLVPNLPHLQLSLRFIKYWAMVRGINSAVFGYLGGIAWTILTARICQLYPNALAIQVVVNFFKIYKQWNWKHPIVLQKIKKPQKTLGLMKLRAWDPESNVQDRHHIMPIITPAFPSMNTSHTVSPCTFKIIMSEITRAEELLDSKTGANGITEEVLNGVLLPYKIFEVHKNFIEIQIFAQDSSLFNKWEGWVASKIRLLSRKLEQINGVTIRPWSKSYPFKDVDWKYASSYFIGLSFNVKLTSSKVDLRSSVSGFMNIINAWPEKGDGADVKSNVRHLKSTQIPLHLRETQDMETALRLTQKSQLEGDLDSAGNKRMKTNNFNSN